MLAYFQFLLTDLAYKFGRPFAALLMERSFDVMRHIPPVSARSVDLLTTAYRFHPSVRRHRKLLQCKGFLVNRLDMAAEGARNAEAVRDRTLVLKNPTLRQGGLEKGVLLIKFTETFKDVFVTLDCAELEKYFWIVLEPSWSGYALPEIHCWMSLRSPVLIESSETQDFDYINSLGSNLVPVRFGSSDWVDDRIFFPAVDENDIEFDSIYIANFSLMKRHHTYLKAIADTGLSDYKAALVCGAWGSHREKVFQMVRYFGLTNVVDYFEEVPQSKLNELLNRSRLNVLMSLKEGSNRTIFEGFFADTPGLVLAENIGVNKNYINENTGYLIQEADLAKTLVEDRSRVAGRFRPREWAIENISAHRTTKKLNFHLSTLAAEVGELWTESAVAKVNAPEAVYYDQGFADTHWSGQELVELFEKGKVDAAKIESKLER